MSFSNIFGIAASAINAQSVRLNLTASNMANADTTASTEQGAFKAKRATFQTLVNNELAGVTAAHNGGVKVSNIVDNKAATPRLYEPGHPNADANGMLFKSNVNEVSEMVEMMSASRAFQNNVEVLNTARELLLRTIDTIKS